MQPAGLGRSRAQSWNCESGGPVGSACGHRRAASRSGLGCRLSRRVTNSPERSCLKQHNAFIIRVPEGRGAGACAQAALRGSARARGSSAGWTGEGAALSSPRSGRIYFLGIGLGMEATRSSGHVDSHQSEVGARGRLGTEEGLQHV